MLGERGSHVGQKNENKLEGNVLRACVTPLTPACLNGLETVVLTEQ